MPGPAERMVRVLTLELALLEAEAGLVDELIRTGVMPAGARRTPTVPEIRGRVHFGELDRIVEQATARLLRHTDAVRDAVLDGLAEALARVSAEADPWRAFEELERITNPAALEGVPGLAQALDDATTGIRAELLDTAQAGANEALAEAGRQGLAGLPDVPAGEAPAILAAADAHAARVARVPATRLLDVAATAAGTAAAAQGATGLSVVSAALDAAELASTAGIEDTARQAANSAHGLGRTEALTMLPQPAEVYASELLDRNTCGPCATVDGRVYLNLEAALVDYPGAGGYVLCDGGARCRGTLVLIHDTEAEPTRNTPGDGRSPGQAPVDRTPKGPSAPPPANPAAAPVPTGPLPPDAGVAAAGSIHTSDVDPSGRSVMPVEDLEAPIEVTPVDEFIRDPELATFSSDELEAVLVDDAVDVERRTAAALELDARDAGKVERADFIEEDLDAETLAAYERDREAWEAAGGYAADATYGSGGRKVLSRRGGGRAIDLVKDEWADQLHMDYVAAEDYTRGVLLRNDRVAEFTAKYGNDTAALFEGPARTAYYYASRELRDFWENNPRLSFSEFAVQRGILDAKTRARAAAAARARDDGMRIAEESAERKAAKKRIADQKRRPKTAGERLELERRRRERIAAQERKLRLEAGYEDVPEVPDVVPPAPDVIPEPVPDPVPDVVPEPIPAPEPPPPPAPTSALTPELLERTLNPTRKRTAGAIRKDLEATPEGKALTAAIKQFTETRGGVANLRKNLAATLDGTASPAVQARARAFLEALNSFPVDEVPTLFRGFAVRVEDNTAAWWDAFEAQFKPGETINLNASSFSASEKKAAEFASSIGGTRRASSNYTAVRFILEGDTHALPVERLSKFASEKEWIAGGEFEVVSFSPATKAQPYARVVIRQRQSLEAP